jgi:LmbE family N-acetylglucosaminyl deacetylase
LAIGAHPDDIEFMMAGTLILLKRAGWQPHYLNLCDGCCGTVTEEPAAIAARRKLEAQAACRQIGARFHPPVATDIQLYHTTEAVARVTAVIRRVKPRILLLPSPDDYMEDHMNASRIGATAAFVRGVRNFPCEPPRPAIGGEITLYHALPYGLRDGLRRRIRPGQYVDIGAALKAKRRMLACHVSQKKWLDHSQGLDSYLATMEAMAREVGEWSGRFAAAEGWRRHSHLGYSAADGDPLAAALGARCFVDQDYEAALDSGVVPGS